MPGNSPSQHRQTSRIAWIAVGIAAVLGLFIVENLWIDARLRHRLHGIPSFVPAAQSTPWFLVFAAGAIALLLLVVCLVLLLKDQNASTPIKLGTFLMVALVMLLSLDWFRVTNGQPGIRSLLGLKRAHKVVLTWRPSPSQITGYNVYRKSGQTPGYQKLNVSPVQGLSYTDDTIENGKTYSYVARSVNSHGEESKDSETFTVTIP
jgi:hypothetical protein